MYYIMYILVYIMYCVQVQLGNFLLKKRTPCCFSCMKLSGRASRQEYRRQMVLSILQYMCMCTNMGNQRKMGKAGNVGD